MSSSRLLEGVCEKNCHRGEIGGKGGSLHYPQGKRPRIGRKLTRSTVHRATTSYVLYRKATIRPDVPMNPEGRGHSSGPSSKTKQANYSGSLFPMKFASKFNVYELGGRCGYSL